MVDDILLAKMIGSEIIMWPKLPNQDIYVCVNEEGYSLGCCGQIQRKQA